MNERGPIIVPLDGSELAEGALAVATAVAHAERTHLVLLSVWEDTPSVISPAISMQVEAAARDYFEKYLDGIRERLHQPELRTIVRCGDAADAINTTADELGARMIVLTTHGRSGLGAWLYGSTTRRLLHESRLPLLVVGPQAVGRTDRTQVKHVMVPLDGSARSELAIVGGIAIASAFSAKLSLVQAVPWSYEMYPYATAAMYVPDLDRDLEAGALEYIQRRTARISEVEAHGFVVRGLAADALMAFAECNDVDLIVMTTHARTGIARAALGSVAERMLHASAPVLLLRPGSDTKQMSAESAGRPVAVATQ